MPNFAWGVHNILPFAILESPNFSLGVLSGRSNLTGMQAESHDEQPAIIYKLTSILDRIEPAQLFCKQQPLEVELGAGDGSFIIQYTRQHPEHNMIGVERLLGRLRKIDKKGLRAGLTNLRAMRIEASYFLEWLLPPKAVTALHVYFPDPWPKRKHRKFRLVNERFTELTAQVLVPGGIVYLRTDDLDYFGQMTEVFAADARFAMVPTPESLCSIVTDFERNFNAKGISTQRAAYRLREVAN
ncbi:MAG: tRNA ((7)-)-methyltransferase [Verrucomicrobiales bacterium]|nr:tRNA ((7)-)-methyltransferase [Verrucomicrobiales bacterium]